jgi:Flp pilus assembly protein TadD/ketosteroid isomerase-like protein
MAVLATTSVPARADEYDDIDKLFGSGQWSEAVLKADQFIAAHPRDARMRFLKGLALAELARNADAIAVFVKLTEDFPDLPEPHNNLAVLYSKQGQYEQARKSLEAAIRTNPSYATAYENLGDVYAKLASQAYAKALQMDGGNTAKVAPKLAMIRDLFTPRAAAVTVASAKPSPSPAKPSPAPAPVAAPPAPAVTKPPAPASAPGVVAAASKPAAASTTATDRGAAAQEAQAAALAWASAWSAKDVPAYLAAYTPEFSGGKSRKAWEEERRARIVGKSSISVTLSDVEARMQGDKAIVQFRQHYSADALKVSSRKTLEMVKVGGRWLIQKESTGS